MSGPRILGALRLSVARDESTSEERPAPAGMFLAPCAALMDRRGPPRTRGRWPGR